MKRIIKFNLGLILYASLWNCNEVTAKNQSKITDAAATCYGRKNCKACKTCNYCKHCNNGGKCSVCK